VAPLDKPKPAIRLLVVEMPGTDLFPSSRNYAAILTNDGSEPVSLEAVQMRGGYAGDGRFLSCSLQMWSEAKKKWIVPHPASLSDFGRNPQVIQIHIKPHEKLEACRMLLPQQGGHPGDSARFAVSFHWSQQPNVLSKRFVIISTQKAKLK
jgi:hypothetical protein